MIGPDDTNKATAPMVGRAAKALLMLGVVYAVLGGGLVAFAIADACGFNATCSRGLVGAVAAVVATVPAGLAILVFALRPFVRRGRPWAMYAALVPNAVVTVIGGLVLLRMLVRVVLWPSWDRLLVGQLVLMIPLAPVAGFGGWAIYRLWLALQDDNGPAAGQDAIQDQGTK